MSKYFVLPLAVAALLIALAGPARAAGAAEMATAPIRIDIPVKLEKANVLFNMDHLAFTGDMPIGMKYMDLLAKRYAQWHTKGKIIAVFQGPAAYMVLNDKAYNANRHVSTGNPYKETVAALIRQGVQIEECGFSMQVNKWGNADLLPGVKVNTGAIGRIVELAQQGYVQIQP